MGWDDIEKTYKRLEGLERDGGDLLYHYRSLEGFWKLIESDSFWATNARFSNDEEEQRLGMTKMREAYWESGELPEVTDCYIVCFCEKDDKLSQWRGYAQNGVSIGFDFSNVRPFLVVSADGKKDGITVYNGCCKVGYFSFETTKENIYEWTCVSAKEYDGAKKFWNRVLMNRIPFIKHKGFIEEDEYRLVFEGTELEPYIRYRDGVDTKIPYIVVKPCASDIKRKDVTIRVLFDSTLPKKSEWLKTIKDALPAGGVYNLIECQKKDASIPKTGCCDECIKTRRINLESERDIEDWVDCPGKAGYSFVKEDAIILSDCENQGQVFEQLHKALHTEFGEKAPKIWCEGHLPIRSITIAPNRDAERVRESIEHYCKHKAHWLKDVEIKTSKIPYRS